MKKQFSALTLASVLTAGALTLAGQAVAEELWDPHLRGVDEGLAAGALPPPGVYGVLDNYWISYTVHDQTGKSLNDKSLSALVEVPIVLWATGIKILGADYAVALAQPFDYGVVGSGFGALSGGSGNFGAYNTIVIPGQLAWTFGDFHVKAGLSVYLDDASSTMIDLVKGHKLNGGMPTGNGYSTIQPDLGLSWLHDGWNLSANLYLAVPIDATTTRGYHYQSGNEFAADYTVAKTLDRWTVGVGFHQQNQLNADRLNGYNVANSTVSNYGVGPLIGYQFDGISVMLEWNHNLYAENDVAGDLFNVRFVVPFY
jgi:hypothetical protein